MPSEESDPLGGGEGENQSLVLFRITVLGSVGAGKTSLVSAFVNNFAPQVHVQSTDATLFYKTMQLPAKLGDENNNPFPLLVEIEDTYASSLDGGQDSYGHVRDVKSFLDMSRAPKSKRSGEALSAYDVPKVVKYNPLSCGRMGFVIVFDVNDEASLTEAIQLNLSLEFQMQKKKAHYKPVVYLVGNKIDKDPSSCFRIRRSAQLFTDEKRIKLFEVSAFELRKVKAIFRQMLLEIRENPVLWRLDQTKSGDSEDASKKDGDAPAGADAKKDCVVQ
eukprot:gnl/TRDRNA2_/TRDRNA2_81680_c0_seq2.p1 gnl/TRDRNA2_/TRDRNA2_81680_c0~~gnl/TRDRNA2_/TRDRNA2_81680_c0_seq2.p1  ORF type:complete len:276 (+),score=54.87 gnl/TRDRNA2_/TRDRNA2_81680_c0_seq2:111-938(+)